MKVKLSERTFLTGLIFILIILSAVFTRTIKTGGLVVPWGLIAIFISIYLFREYNRVRRAKKEERKRYLNEHRQKILDNVTRKKKNAPFDKN